MTWTPYSITFIVLAIVAVVIIIIIFTIEGNQNALPKYIDTCESFPNEEVYVPSAFYKIQYRGGDSSTAGGQAASESICAKNCREISACAGYLYNNGKCYLLDESKIDTATYYCKHGTGLMVTPNFAAQYRQNYVQPIVGHGYFKENRIPASSIIKAPGALDQCLTLRTKASNRLGIAATNIWSDLSYKIPELEYLDMANYQQGGDCKSYCSSLGGYQLPWCYTDIGYVPGTTDISNKNSKWGFCTNGCVGYDCFEGFQTPFIPQEMAKEPKCTNCINPGPSALRQCGSCGGCVIDGAKTCPEQAPASWPPSQKSNYYCLYPGSDDETKCCTEKNLCNTLIEPPGSYVENVAPVAVPTTRLLKKGWGSNASADRITISYPFADPTKLLGTCLNEANCRLPIGSPDAAWCKSPTPFKDNKEVAMIYNPTQNISDPDYGKCPPPLGLPDTTKCCIYDHANHMLWEPSKLLDSYWVESEEAPKPETNISRSCRTKCTDLNLGDPPNPLHNKWCISDPYYPALALGGSPISFPIDNADFDAVGGEQRSFWQWGFCNEETCKNKLAWVSAPVTSNIYPKVSGQ